MKYPFARRRIQWNTATCPRLGGLADAVVDLLVHHAQGRAQVLRLLVGNDAQPGGGPVPGGARGGERGGTARPALRRRRCRAPRDGTWGWPMWAPRRPAERRPSRARAPRRGRRGVVRRGGRLARRTWRDTAWRGWGRACDATQNLRRHVSFFHPVSCVLVCVAKRKSRFLVARAAKSPPMRAVSISIRIRIARHARAGRRSASTRSQTRAELANAVHYASLVVSRRLSPPFR